MRMRMLVPILVIAGCGPVELGDERVVDAGYDAAVVVPARGPEPSRGSDAGSNSVRVRVAIVPDGCDGCANLSASASGGVAPYTFEWDDGSHDAMRHVCPATLPSSIRVTARDARGNVSVPHVTDLTLPNASCPPPMPLLSLENPSFEGTPAINLGFGNGFDCDGWSTCLQGGGNSTPDVVNPSVGLPANVPAAEDGDTYLGLTENEQVSQELGRGVAGGSALALKLDLRRLYLGVGLAPDSEKAFLEIYGGVVPGCTSRELLWSSPSLPNDDFQTYCAVLRPTQFTNRIVLRATSDQTQLLPSYVLVDNLQPVSSCP
jgi:hypothetical protein